MVHSMSRSSLTAAAAMAAIWRRTVWARGKGGAQRTFSWARYQELLQAGGAVSVATKALTSAAIVGAGDVACQTLLERRSLMARSTHQHESQGPEHLGDTAVEGCGRAAASRQFDYARLGNMTLLGAVLVAPVLHVWYGFLGRKIPGSSVGSVVGRVALDQVVFAPTFIAVFFSALAGLEGKNLQQLEQQLRESWAESVVTNWKIWVPCQIVNLGFVPGHLQVLVSNIVALVWNSYMSYITHRPVIANTVEARKL